jgi:hypothetical protein
MHKITVALCGFLLCLLVSQSSQAACDYTGAWHIIQDNGPVVEVHIETTGSKSFGVVGSDGGSLGSIELLHILQPPTMGLGLYMGIRWQPAAKGDDGQFAGYLGYIRSDGHLYGGTWTKDGEGSPWHSDKAFQC